jgi:putative ABC transport system ATP-binding protein
LLYAKDPHATDLREQKARQCLAMVGLAGREDHYPNQLSGGQQQRVAIARSMINDPAIVLADEPTGNLDSRTSEDVMAVFQDLNRSGKTVVLITHEPDIARFARRVVVFKDGKVLTDDVVEQQTARSADAAVTRGAA